MSFSHRKRPEASKYCFSVVGTPEPFYPDSSDTDSTGTDQVTTEWNVDGTMKKRKGPGSAENARTILEYTFNGCRQVELERATQLGTDIDGAIKSIKHEYDTLGRQYKVSSYSNDDGIHGRLQHLSRCLVD